MPRAGRQVPNVYFGRPGALVTMPWPVGDQDGNYEKPVFDFLTGTGQHVLSTLSGGSRLFKVNWNALHVDNYARIEQYWTGMMGTGPWAYIDPSARNLLLPNQASASSTYNDPVGWATSFPSADQGTLTSNSNATYIHRAGAPRSVRWNFTVTATAFPGLVFTSAYRNWFGVPCVPGLPYAWSTWARPDNVIDSAITLAAKLTWLNAAGGTISEISGGDISLTGWTRLSTTGVAPAGAAYCRPILVATGATIAVGSSLYLDEPLLEQDSVINDWAPGTGLRPVEIAELPERVPFDTRMRTGLALQLRELAA
jgi:hypothetical protein